MFNKNPVLNLHKSALFDMFIRMLTLYFATVKTLDGSLRVGIRPMSLNWGGVPTKENPASARRVSMSKLYPEADNLSRQRPWWAETLKGRTFYPVNTSIRNCGATDSGHNVRQNEDAFPRHTLDKMAWW